MGQEEFSGDRAFYIISFHKHNEKKNPANRIANSAGLGKLFQVNIKHLAHLEIDDKSVTMTGNQKLIRRVAFHYREGVGRKCKSKGTAVTTNSYGFCAIALGPPTAPRSKGSSQGAP